MIHERDLTFAAIKKKHGSRVESNSIKSSLDVEMEMAAGVKIICKDRKGTGMLRGGGICFAFRSSIVNFKERKIKGAANFELLCEVSKEGAIKRK